MFGIEDLNEYIEITESTIKCPVKCCGEKVDMQLTFTSLFDRIWLVLRKKFKSFGGRSYQISIF
ncbi:TPA: hypothetical protein ENX78_06835 [Candidatus Poribacteria bacterium]|nr:hypothetical protein [Candidatus Poribacteria bacterium]